MNLKWMLTIAANVALLAVLYWRKPKDARLILASIWINVATTAAMLYAQHALPVDHGTHDALFNRLWACCDVADAFAEGLAAVWLWRRSAWDAMDWRPLVFLDMCAHLYLKVVEYWAHDPFNLQDWLPTFHLRSWLNILIGFALWWVIMEESRKRAPQEIQ